MNVRTIRPVKGLKGEVTIPGDKSISHRSIMLGSIALGTTEITHFLEGADCLSTIDCFRRMGVEIERKPSCILVHGKGLRGLSAPASTLNVGPSGRCHHHRWKSLCLPSLIQRICNRCVSFKILLAAIHVSFIFRKNYQQELLVSVSLGERIVRPLNLSNG